MSASPIADQAGSITGPLIGKMESKNIRLVLAEQLHDQEAQRSCTGDHSRDKSAIKMGWLSHTCYIGRVVGQSGFAATT